MMSKKPTMGERIDELNKLVGTITENRDQWQTAHGRLKEENKKLKDQIAVEQANNMRGKVIAAQMKGFIRAHHTERIPTGTQEYNAITGNMEAGLVDRYPFQEIELD
jgi:hypothetical protein